MSKVNKPVYSLLESSLFQGGIKVKMDGKTCAQFPNLAFAKNYCKTILAKDKELYKIIEFQKNDGTIEQIQLFD